MVRTPDDVAAVEQLGADTVLTNLEPQQPSRSPLGGVTLTVDAVGGDLLDRIVGWCEPSARIGSFATPGDGMVTFDLRAFYRSQLHLMGLNSGH